ncbi:hypothetical protein ACH4SP_07665 [Streptomyces sp. NPDC021093]|uniref:hypothetical protein n=1 Tax=Streptomyces sp. NPDC021093 TaxID=3365112 RepID=UPI0037BB1BC9
MYDNLTLYRLCTNETLGAPGAFGLAFNRANFFEVGNERLRELIAVGSHTTGEDETDSRESSNLLRDS